MPFDAVLMDMQMPDIDGRGDPENPRRRALRRAADPAMTASASLADREACLAAGMNDHVAKPIDKERLVLCLLGHLGRSGARARRQRQRTRANWSRRGAISSGVSAAAWS